MEGTLSRERAALWPAHTPNLDVLKELSHQHTHIKAMAGTISGSTGAERLAKLVALREYLIMHETAEQLLLRSTKESLGCIRACRRDSEQGARMVRQLKAAEASLCASTTSPLVGATSSSVLRAEPLNLIVERTYRAINATT